ncbi:MAG: hypothetical protein ACJA1M_000715 [Alphaproteobacteria bacterium]|jgi:hypothetical protein
MTSKWEKQILAYCINVSRGILPKSILKIQINETPQTHNTNNVSVMQFIEIVAYIIRLKHNLKDSKRKRGFKCHIEIGSNIPVLLKKEQYNFDLLSKKFPVSYHQLEENSVQIYFDYDNEVQKDPACDSDHKVASKNTLENQLLLGSEIHLEDIIQKKISKKFEFINDDALVSHDNKADINTSQNHTNTKQLSDLAQGKIFMEQDGGFIEIDDVVLENPKNKDNNVLVYDFEDVQEFEFVDDGVITVINTKK